MDFHSYPATYTAVAVLTLYLSIKYLSRADVLKAIPTVRPSGLLMPYLGPFNYVFGAHKMIQKGYDRFYPKPFKIAELYRWRVIITGEQQIEEFRRLGDDELSFPEGNREALRLDVLFGPVFHDNAYHISVIKSQLNRNLPLLFPEIRSEIIAAFDDILSFNDDGSCEISAYQAALHVVCRTSNRLFVGLPLCRDPDYLELNSKFVTQLAIAAMTVNIFPNFMVNLVAKMFRTIPASISRANKHLASIVDERRQNLKDFGADWAEKPNDMLTWLLESSDGQKESTEDVVKRILLVNFASIHTTSMSLTFILLQLVSNPEYIEPLREEVISVTQAEGWTKVALSKMHKLDSFVRESHRFNGMDHMGMNRKALKDITFSDGTFLPAGTYVSVASYARHHDGQFYERPDVFDGFRYVRRAGEKDGPNSQRTVSTSAHFIPFGHGKHACPGRFFAAAEHAFILAHIILNYDIELVHDPSVPFKITIAVTTMPNPKAKIIFKKRKSKLSNQG